MIVGCGSEPTQSPESIDMPAPESIDMSLPERSMEEIIEEIVIKNRALICRSLFQCPEYNLGRLGFGSEDFANEQACAQVQEENKFSFYKDEVEAAWQGRKVLSRDRAESCLADINSQLDVSPCDHRITIRSPCLSIFDGAIEVGEPCLRGDCQSKFARCEFEEGGEQCFGTCQISPSSKCSQITCEENEVCLVREDVAACVKRIPIGEPCDRGDICGLEGELADCLVQPEQSVCTKIWTVPEGGRCGESDMVCQRALDCIEGICTRPEPTLIAYEQGDNCDDVPCAPGLRCDLEVATCEPYATEGMMCRTSLDCANGLKCSDSTGSGEYVCTPRRDLGQSCKVNSDCKNGNCIDDTCAPEPESCMLP